MKDEHSGSYLSQVFEIGNILWIYFEASLADM